MKTRSSEKSRHRFDVEQNLKKFRVRPEVTLRAAEKYLAALDSPRALTVWLLFSNKEHNQLVDLECNPLDYNSMVEFRDAYAATMFFAKSNFLALNVDRTVAAMQKFEKFELLCKQTNNRFRRLHLDPKYKGSNVTWLHAMRRKIYNILGDFDTSEMLDGANWGPGVTNTIKGERAAAVNKFQYETGITRDLYSLVGPSEREKISLFAAYPHWQPHLFALPGFPKFEVGNVTVTVPKNAKIDRVICIEPGLNLWFQQGVGKMIRRRLLRVGIDLRNQTRNQQLARCGVKLQLATVDFSSASDSISQELVREVLPPDWFEWMDAMRSKYGILRGSGPRKWEKFSSMGNGFTFQLESLLFYAAACAIAETEKCDASHISAYGDDVIIPCSLMEKFTSFCEFLGFVVNPDKSFWTGRFRESCGAHFYDGVDVKPIFLKEMLGAPATVYKLANAIRIMSHNRLNGLGCDVSFKDAFVFLVTSVPKSLRFRIPLGPTRSKRYGDGGFVSNFDEAVPQRLRNGIEGYRTKHAAVSSVRAHSEDIGLLLTRYRSLPTSQEDKPDELRTPQEHHAPSVPEVPLGNNFALRGRVKQRVSWLEVPQWYDLGPWF